MHWILGTALTGVSGVVLDAVPVFSTFQVVLLVILLVIVILSAMSLWLRQGEARAKFFREPLTTIPDGTEDEGVWNSWLLKMEALLRGKGMKRKSDILRSTISRADPLDRPEIAENFFRGLAQESMESPS